jgi:hypothetical protein
MSTGTDLNTGGASYFFTRIKSERMAGRIPGITFKVGNLSRLDAYSYAGDKFGDVRPVGKNGAGIEPASYRALTPTEWKEYATHSSNETLFKSGFHLLDDVQNIRVNTAQQRDKIIKTFADHGYTALPDGRAIEDVVLVKR